MKRGDSFSTLVLTDRNNKQVELTIDTGKLLLLDFWNVHCGACITAMPKLDSLKQIMGDTLKIVSVTTDSEEKVAQLFRKLKLKHPSFPMIVGDSILSRLFPHEGDPYYIWITGGRIAYISNGWSLTYDNIKSMLAGNRLNLTQRLPLPEGYTSTSQLLTQSLVELEEYSLLLTGLDNYHIGGSIHTLIDSIYDEPYFLKAINQSRLQLIIKAYWNEIFSFETRHYLNPNRFIVVDSSAKDLMFSNNNQDQDDWRRKNLFSYEVKVNLAGGNNLYKRMREDVTRFFPYDVVFETKLLPSLVLEVSDSTLFNKIKAPSFGSSRLDWKTTTIEVRNLSLNNSIVQLISESQFHSNGPLCINNTGYEGKINMILPLSLFNDLDILQKSLSGYGLKLVQKNFPVKTIVIKKR
ncbi:MAG: redoxin family protein [Ferruginibacter sp.]|nr:redoxin family protein [Bacteroidota bacterium]MBX2920170.1 redoxin family protein [Ferruginibacter sp.]